MLLLVLDERAPPPPLLRPGSDGGREGREGGREEDADKESRKGSDIGGRGVGNDSYRTIED